MSKGKYPGILSFSDQGIVILKLLCIIENGVINLNLLYKRRKLLETAADNLKKKFVGIDKVIDKLTLQVYT